MEVEVAKVFMSKIIDIDSKTTNFNKSGIKSDDFTLTIPNIRLKGSTTNIEINVDVEVDINSEITDDEH